MKVSGQVVEVRIPSVLESSKQNFEIKLRNNGRVIRQKKSSICA